MACADTWTAAYGPADGTWLLDKFNEITAGLKHCGNVRIARQDDEEEMVRYRDAIRETMGTITGDWDLTSPTTGVVYTMGCDWHE